MRHFIKIFGIVFCVFCATSVVSYAQESSGTTQEAEGTGKYNPTDEIMHHISNANEFHFFGKYSIPLPCLMYSKQDGFKFFMSSVFEHGEKAFDRYALDHGVVRRILDQNFPMGSVDLQAAHEDHFVTHEMVGDEEVGAIQYNGKKYELEKASLLTKQTSFYDFSISKNVFTMLMAFLTLLFLLGSMAKSYAVNKNKAPKGIQSLLEPVIIFIRDDVAKPMIGDKYEKFLPLLLSLFFFILIINLFGLIPFAPFGGNVTGNIATTAALALVAFVVTNLNGKADYWKHIVWMPGVPVVMKVFLAPIELIGVFTKPISLMIRLFANITAGHIIILALVSLIFVFGNAGESMIGSGAGMLISVPFTLFLSVIEIIVAFIQAYIFTILTASYIGAATEDHH